MRGPSTVASSQRSPSPACVRVQFRNGLLSVLEVGLERFTPDSYPATILPILVVRVDFTPDDFGQVTMLRTHRSRPTSHSGGPPSQINQVGPNQTSTNRSSGARTGEHTQTPPRIACTSSFPQTPCTCITAPDGRSGFPTRNRRWPALAIANDTNGCRRAPPAAIPRAQSVRPALDAPATG